MDKQKMKMFLLSAGLVAFLGSSVLLSGSTAASENSAFPGVVADDGGAPAQSQDGTGGGEISSLTDASSGEGELVSGDSQGDGITFADDSSGEEPAPSTEAPSTPAPQEEAAPASQEALPVATDPGTQPAAADSGAQPPDAMAAEPTSAADTSSGSSGDAVSASDLAGLFSDESGEEEGELMPDGISVSDSATDQSVPDGIPAGGADQSVPDGIPAGGTDQSAPDGISQNGAAQAEGSLTAGVSDASAAASPSDQGTQPSDGIQAENASTPADGIQAASQETEAPPAETPTETEHAAETEATGETPAAAGEASSKVKWVLPNFLGTLVPSFTSRPADSFTIGLYVRKNQMAGYLPKYTGNVTSGQDVVEISDLTINASGSGFTAVAVQGTAGRGDSPSTVDIENVDIVAADDEQGINASDFTGLGSLIVASGVSEDAHTRVNVHNMNLVSTGFVRDAILANDHADVLVRDSNITVNGADPMPGGDAYSSYVSSGNQAYMISPPWVLGISGGARAANVLGDGSSLSIVNSSIKAGGWGVLSTDNCQSPVINTLDSTLSIAGSDETYGLNGGAELFGYGKNYGSGYGSYAIGGANENFYGTTFDNMTYASIMTGSGKMYYGRSYNGLELKNAAGDVMYTGQEAGTDVEASELTGTADVTIESPAAPPEGQTAPEAAGDASPAAPPEDPAGERTVNVSAPETDAPATTETSAPAAAETNAPAATEAAGTSAETEAPTAETELPDNLQGGQETVVNTVFGIMDHQGGSAVLDRGSVWNTEDAVILKKGGSVSDYTISGAELHSASGTIFQMMDNDDGYGISSDGGDSSRLTAGGTEFGSPTFSGGWAEPAGEAGLPSDLGNLSLGGTVTTTVLLKNGKYTGNLYNAKGSGKGENGNGISVELDNAELDGVISSTEAVAMQ